MNCLSWKHCHSITAKRRVSTKEPFIAFTQLVARAERESKVQTVAEKNKQKSWWGKGATSWSIVYVQLRHLFGIGGSFIVPCGFNYISVFSLLCASMH